MNIIIDGYNLLKQVCKKKEITERERSRFGQFAASYATKKKHTIYIIYDGGPFDRPTSEKRGSVITVYSGRRSTADDVIKTYIDEKILKDMLIVTTDRQLTNYAAHAHIPSLDSLDFYGFMQGLASKIQERVGFKKVSGEAHKLHEEEVSPELDALMQEAASVLLYKREEDEEKAKKGQKPSKKERIALALLKKL